MHDSAEFHQIMLLLYGFLTKCFSLKCYSLQEVNAVLSSVFLLCNN